MVSKSTPPAPTELEVSVFGPGVGECVVVHLGEGEWAIVDSCLDASTRQPIALQYLRALGVDVARDVRLVIVSHFHDDHVRGLTEIVEACQQAQFVCAAALRQGEFWELLEANRRSGIEESGTTEFDRVLQLLGARGKLHGRVISPTYAMSGSVIYREGDGASVRLVEALSPSSVTMTAAHLRIGALLPRAGAPRTATPAIGANDLSLALWVRSGDVCALLGGDLEESGRVAEGWQAVVASPVRPTGRAVIFKVPHHGSPTSHHAPVWTEMLAPQPFAVSTPYTRGSRKLPTRADVLRMCGYTPHVYVTSLALRKPPRARASSVDRIVQAIAKDRQVVASDMGQVRIRIKASGSAAVDMFDAGFLASCKGA